MEKVLLRSMLYNGREEWEEFRAELNSMKEPTRGEDISCRIKSLSFLLKKNFGRRSQMRMSFCLLSYLSSHSKPVVISILPSQEWMKILLKTMGDASCKLEDRVEDRVEDRAGRIAMWGISKNMTFKMIRFLFFLTKKREKIWKRWVSRKTYSCFMRKTDKLQPDKSWRQVWLERVEHECL